MKRVIATMGAMALAAAIAMPAQAETTLRITLQLPLKAHLGQNLLMFKEEVEKESKGDIKVEIYDSAQLYKDKEVPQAVGSGAIEMGVASLTRYVGEIPAVDIFYRALHVQHRRKVRAAVAPGSAVRQPIDDAILKTGSRVLWWQAYGGAIMLSKGGPLKTPADIKDKKVRVFGTHAGQVHRNPGRRADPDFRLGTVCRLPARHGRRRHDRRVRRQVAQAVGSDGHHHRHQPRRHRVHRGGQREILAVAAEGPAGHHSQGRA